MDKRILRILGSAIFLAAWNVQPASAHAPAPHGVDLWAQWSFDPVVLLGSLLAGLVYLRGWRVTENRGSVPRQTTLRKITFLSGLAVLVLALVSPLDALAEQLFSAHMVQHTLLTMIAPPLLVLGMPLPALLLGLPRRVQVGLGQAWKSAPGLHAVWKALTRPMLVWLVMTAVFWGWHAPAFYTAAVENDLIHILQHSTFFVSALLFWWIVLRVHGDKPERRGTGVIYLFFSAMQSGLLGALITFSRSAWYPIYASRSEAWGLSALADQQLAGTIMWVPAGLVFLLAALALLKTIIDRMPSEEGIAPQKELK